MPVIFLFFSRLFVVCLYSECDKFQSNFVLVMYPCLGHVLFIYSFFLLVHRCKIHIFKFFYNKQWDWSTIPFAERKNSIPMKMMANKICRFCIKKIIYTHTHTLLQFECSFFRSFVRDLKIACSSVQNWKPSNLFEKYKIVIYDDSCWALFPFLLPRYSLVDLQARPQTHKLSQSG